MSKINSCELAPQEISKINTRGKKSRIETSPPRKPFTFHEMRANYERRLHCQLGASCGVCALV